MVCCNKTWSIQQLSLNKILFLSLLTGEDTLSIRRILALSTDHVYFFLCFSFFTGGWLFHNAVLASPLSSLPHPAPLLIPSISGHHRELSWAPCSVQVPTGHLFTHGRVYILILLFQFIPSSLFPVSVCSSSTSVSLFCPVNRFVSTIFLDAIHVH